MFHKIEGCLQPLSRVCTPLRVQLRDVRPQFFVGKSCVAKFHNRSIEAIRCVVVDPQPNAQSSSGPQPAAQCFDPHIDPQCFVDGSQSSAVDQLVEYLEGLNSKPDCIVLLALPGSHLASLGEMSRLPDPRQALADVGAYVTWPRSELDGYVMIGNARKKGALVQKNGKCIEIECLLPATPCALGKKDDVDWQLMQSSYLALRRYLLQCAQAYTPVCIVGVGISTLGCISAFLDMWLQKRSPEGDLAIFTFGIGAFLVQGSFLWNFVEVTTYSEDFLHKTCRYIEEGGHDLQGANEFRELVQARPAGFFIWEWLVTFGNMLALSAPVLGSLVLRLLLYAKDWASDA